MSIYLSDWNPRGVRKDYDRCSIALKDAQRILGEYAQGKVVDACAWFDTNDALRILVADTAEGRRLTARVTKRHWSISIDYRAEEQSIA